MASDRLITKRLLTLDEKSKEPVVRVMSSNERSQYFFAEAVGLLVFQPWYNCIAEVGHHANALSYGFPVRIKFVSDFLDPKGFVNNSDNDWRGWNQPEWIKAAQTLQEEGVRAIVCSCGLTGNMQSILQAAVEIPVFSSTLMFVASIHKQQANGKRIGILTVSAEHLLAHQQIILEECGIDEAVPIAILGMNESAGANEWLTMTTPKYDFEKVQQAVVDACLKMQHDNNDLGAIVLECTDMPMYSDAIREATGLYVFDAVDMTCYVNDLVR
jgi:Asp/Glu/hydantoin racemase